MIPFLITIDTEGDNLWSHPREINTKNAQGLLRFQSLCNEYGFKPVYLTNYEMAMDDFFVSFAKKCADKGECEIGMHLHPWNSPPIIPLTSDDYQYQPFLIEYPHDVIEKKVQFMTSLLEERFERKIYSHRAGRWCINTTYISILKEYGYHTDCSVTPHVDWSSVKGNPSSSGGVDYSMFPDSSYYLDEKNLSQKGSGTILEVPMTIILKPRFRFIPGFGLNLFANSSKLKKYLFRKVWLRPDSHYSNMSNILNSNKAEYYEFMIHSSELSAGLNPTFKTEESIEMLYKSIRELFESAKKKCSGMTLEDFYQQKQRINHI